MSVLFIKYSIGSLCVIGLISYFWPPVLWMLFVIIPIVFCGVYDMLQTKHTLWRNFPVVGRGRWIMEALRPPLYQYFVESDIEGVPVNWMFRSVVYQRSKKEQWVVSELHSSHFPVGGVKAPFFR